VTLKDLKESFPLELALYAVSQDLQDEPAFAWWLPYVLKKQRRILKKVKSKYWSRTHKYGIRVPKSIKEAIEIDRENGNTLWMDAVKLEMANVRIAFEEFEGDPNSLIGYTQITGHLVFDVSLAKTFEGRRGTVQMATKRVHQHPSRTARSCLEILCASYSLLHH
jgi:hypothetical protein